MTAPNAGAAPGDASARGDRPVLAESDRPVRGNAPRPGLPAPRPPVLNIANVLTILRLALVPVFVCFLFAGPETDGWRYAAFGAYAVAAITDQIDGTVARRRGLITDFGILVDPIADKALTGAALVSLSALGELPWAVTIVVAVREIGVTLLRLWVIRFGVIAASRGGKAKTLLLNISLGLYVLPLDGATATGRAVILGCGVIVAVVTGVDYVYRALVLRRRAGTAAVPGQEHVDGATAGPGTGESGAR